MWRRKDWARRVNWRRRTTTFTTCWDLLESNRGHSAEAIADWRKAVELNPKNLRATYQLAEEIERQGDENGAAEFQRLVEKILAAQPENLAALLELSRIAAKRGDAATLKSAVERIEKQSAGWPPEAKQQLDGTADCGGGGRSRIRPRRAQRFCETC